LIIWGELYYRSLRST